MTDDPDPDDAVTVAADGVTVEKRFTADEFPVPAVKFVLRSEAEETVTVRLTDEIPESFDMEGIGFHPDYDGEEWTAYRDHRVEYERTLDPGEEVTTVYGVRLDDPSEGVRFLGEPGLESLSADDDRATPDDVLGRETTRAVRDALAGEGELAETDDGAGPTLDPADPAPPSDDVELAEPEGGATLDLSDPTADVASDDDGATEPATEGDLDLEEPEAADDGDADAEEATAGGPRPVDDDLTPVVGRSDGAAVGTAPEPAPVDDDGTDEADGGDGKAEPTATDDAAGTGATAVPGSVVAALAEEVRSGDVDDDDLAALRDAVDPGVPRSVEVRIDRLQNRTEDLAAYADALEAFIDEEGTAREVLDDLDAETTALREDLEAVEAELDRAADERDDLSSTVDAHDERLADAESDLSALEDRVSTLDGELDTVRESVGEVEDSVEELAGDTDDDLGTIRDTLDDVEATVADLEDELEDLRSFRERMREALGT